MARIAAHRASRRPALLLLVGIVAACSSAPAASTGPGPTGPTTSGVPGPTADATAIAAAQALLNAAKLDNAASLGALESIRFSPAGVEAAKAALGGGASGDQLWAATYVYASSGGDTAPLATVVANTGASASVRAMAAAGLVGRGDVAGFEPLIAGLASSEAMDGSAPAGTIWEFAADVLRRYTSTSLGPTLAATDAERATIQGQWQAWLTDNRAKLRFDGGSQLWVVG